MGKAINAFPDAVRSTLSNPVLFPLTFGVTLLGFLLAFVLGLIPFLGQFLTYATVTTLTAGIIGAIGITITNQNNTTLNNYTTTLSTRGKSVFGAAIIENTIYLTFILLTIFVSFLLISLTGAMPQNEAVGALTILSAAVAVLGYIALVITFQFLTPSIVLGNKTATSAFNTSVNIVKTHPVSVIGYTIARLSLFIIAFIIIGTIIWATSLISETIAFIIMLPIITAVSVISITIFYSYHTHYYLALESTPTNPPSLTTTDSESESTTQTSTGVTIDSETNSERETNEENKSDFDFDTDIEEK